MADIFERISDSKKTELLLRILTVLVLLYLFLVGVKSLSGGLKLLGSGFAESLLVVTANPFSGLMAGMLATVLFQSSSVTTSIIVGLVAAGTMSVGGAVPMILGANLGTSITNTIVSLGYIRNNTNFKRAFAAATVHDFFNIFSVIVLFPIEIKTGFIEKTSTFLASILYGTSSGVSFSSPIKMAVKPAVHLVQSVSGSFGSTYLAPVMLGFAAVIIITTLSLIVKTMNKVVAQKESKIVDNVFNKNQYGAVGFGIATTIAAQSSSITTSILVPLAGSGVLSLRSIYPVTVGANIGTTATALLAAMTGNVAGLAIALVHLLFNLLGTLIFFVIKPLRELPIRSAEWLATTIDKTVLVGFGYVGFVFFLLPVSMIFLT